MILKEKIREVEIQGDIETQQFTMKASAKAFEILSKNLYSDGIAAVCRELSTNASDTHIANGNPEEPFDIKLPSSLDPTFKIRDYGTGLSEKDIRNIYTTFFESNKTDSNDYTGFLGLGSKSPFAICENFTINSYYNGVKTIYSAFLDKNRVPSLAKFTSHDTTERNGIEIEIASKKEDVYTFEKSMRQQLHYFKVKPNILNDDHFKWYDNDTVLFEYSNWKFLSKSDYHNKAVVIQGQISYPIDTSSMGSLYHNASTLAKSLLAHKVVMEVPIGSVNIAPSREALSYDEDTTKYIIEQAERIVEEMLPLINKSIADAKNEYQAKRNLVNVISNFSGELSSYMDSAERQFKWKNKIITTDELVLLKNDVEEVKYFATFGNVVLRKFKAKPKIFSSIDNEDNIGITLTLYETLHLFYDNGTEKNVPARIKQYLIDNNITNSRSWQNILLIKTDKSQKLIEKRLLGVKTIDVATLEKIRRKPRAKTGPQKLAIHKYNVDSWNKTDAWSATTLDKDELAEKIGFYIDLQGVNAFYNDKKIDDFKSFIRGAIIIGAITPKDEIYGLRTQSRKKSHKMVNIIDFLREKLEKGDIKHIIYPKKSKIITNLDEKYIKILKEKAQNPDIDKIFEAFMTDNGEKRDKNSEKLLDFLEKGIELPNYSKYFENVEKKTPLLKYVFDYSWTNDRIAESTIDYILMALKN